MKKTNKFKIKYKYNRPRTPEEKARQQEILDEAYDMLFDSIVRRKVNEMDRKHSI